MSKKSLIISVAKKCMSISDEHFCPICFVLLLNILLSACASSPRFKDRNQSEKEGEHRNVSDREVHREVSSSGRVLLTLEGIASYYADDFQGKLTSNGETFNMNDLTAAHRTFPFGTKIRVTNLDNNLSVIVRVNDRGPFKEGRMIDLSRGAAKEINLIQTGTARVRLEVLEWGHGE